MENAGPGSRGPGIRGTGSRGVETRGLVENTGSQWKTRGLSGKHGGTIILPNNEVEILLFQIAMKINRRETKSNQIPTSHGVCLLVELGLRVTSRGSRVTSRGPRVNGRGSRVTSRGSKNSSQLFL